MPKGNIVIVEVKPAIPVRGWDYCAYLEGTGEGGFFGWGETEEDAREDLGIMMADFFDGDEEDEDDAEVEK